MKSYYAIFTAYSPRTVQLVQLFAVDDSAAAEQDHLLDRFGVLVRHEDAGESAVVKTDN